MEFIDRFKQYLENPPSSPRFGEAGRETDPLRQGFNEASQKSPSSPLTVKNYIADLRAFVRWVEEYTKRPFTPKDLTEQNIAIYKQQKKIDENGNGISSKSIDRHISSLRKFSQFLVESKLLQINPFQPQAEEKTIDPWHVKEFRDYLYVYGISDLTIKNYVTDIVSFQKWCEEVLGVNDEYEVSKKNPLKKLNPFVIQEYKDRLINVAHLAPASVNRKLSSIRKYLEFAVAQEYIKEEDLSVPNLREEKEAQELTLDDLKKQFAVTERKYSSFPPLRLLQKIITPYFLLEEMAAEKLSQIGLVKSFFGSNVRFSRKGASPQAVISNIPKEMYDPYGMSTKNLSVVKKVIFLIRYKRPNWYKRYKNTTAFRFARFAAVIFVLLFLGGSLYTRLSSPASEVARIKNASSPVFSFTGRLTNEDDSPITSETSLRFSIYDSASASGSALLWQEEQKVKPDTNGVFSTFLGTKTEIPTHVLLGNTALFLGMTVGNTPELFPRQKFGAVAYALDSEALGGMTPITSVNSKTTNTVLALDSTGHLTIGGNASTTFQATSGQFKISGNTLLLTTNLSSNSDVVLAPDGSGTIDLQKYLVNTTENGDIIPGAVQVNDAFVVNANEANTPAAIINNNGCGSGDIFEASASGVERFVITCSGNVGIGVSNPASALSVLGNIAAIGSISATNATLSGILTVNGTGTSTIAGPLNLTSNTLLAPGDLVINPSGGDLILSGTTTINIGGSGSDVAYNAIGASFNGANTSYMKSSNDLYVQGNIQVGNTIYATVSGNLNPGFTQGSVVYAGTGGLLAQNPSNFFWDISNLRLGIGTNSPTSTLTVAGTITTSGNILMTGSSPNIQTNSTSTALTIGGSTTGNIVLTPNNGTGTVTITGYGAGIIHSNSSGVLSSSAVNLAGGSTEITGTLGVSNGGTGSTSVGSTGSVAYSDGSNYTFTNVGSGSQCLVGGTTPSFATCPSGTSDVFWSQTNGLLYPNNSTVDFSIGGQSTASAKFAVLNVNSGTPTATLSGSAGGMFLTADGVIQTTNNQTFTIGGDQTGNIVLSPLNGSGTITLSNLTTAGGILYTGSTGVISQTVGTASQCLLGGTTPVFGPCGTGTDTFWNQTNGLLYPNNSTVDFAIGGQATTSAKFAIINVNSGTPTATLSAGSAGGAYLTADGTLQTTANQTLTIGGATTGNISIPVLNTKGVTVTSDLSGGARSTDVFTITQANDATNNSTGNLLQITQSDTGSTVPAVAIDQQAANYAIYITGAKTITGVGIGIADFTGVGFSTSTIANGGIGFNFGNTIAAGGKGIEFSDIAGTGVNFVSPVTGTGILFASTSLTTGKGISMPISGLTSGTGLSLSGASSGTLTAFTGDVINISPTRTHTGATSIDDTGNYLEIARANTVNNAGGTFTISGDLVSLTSTCTQTAGTCTDTANILALAQNYTSASGAVIELTNAGTGADIDFNSTTPTLTFDDGGSLTITDGTNTLFTLADSGTTGTVTTGTVNATSALQTNSATRIDSSGNLVNIGTTQFNTVTYTWPGADGTTGQVLSTNGIGTLSWVDTANAASIFWNQANGVLFPKNSTVDVTIGGQSTASAKFAFINVNSGTPTASISAGTSGATYLTADGTLQTTANQTLTIGGDTTGNITLSPLNGSGKVTSTGTLNLNSGKTYQINNVDVLSSTTLGSGVTTSSLTTVGALVSGSIASGFGTIETGNTITGTVINGTTGINTGAGAGTQRIDSSGNLTSIGTTQFNSITYTWPGSQSANYVLQTNGSGTLSWADPAGAASSAIFWNQANGALFPKNSTVDLLVGGQSTDSAKFAVLNVNSGTPTGTMAGNFIIKSFTSGSSQLGGNLGIGTTSPQTFAHIYNDSSVVAFNETLRLEGKYTGTGNGALLRFTIANPNGLVPNAGEYNVAGIAGYDFDSNYGGGLAFQTAASGVNGGNSLATRMVIDPNGNVGIGTTVPGKLLDISNTAGAANLRLTGSGGNVEHTITDEYDINYTRTTGGPVIDFRGIPSDGVSAAEYRFGIASGSTGVNQIVLFEPNSSTRQTQLSTSGGTSYLNAQGGNIGIGTTSPAGLLEIRGNPGGHATLIVNQLGATAVDDIFTASAAGTTRFVIKNDGNVGIGTTVPGAKLDVAGPLATDDTIQIAPAAGGAARFSGAITSADLTASGNWSFPDAYGTICISGQTCASSGIVGYWTRTAGNLSPTNLNDTISATTSAAVALTLTQTGAFNAFLVEDEAGDTSPFVIDQSGNVGIGSTAPREALDVNGSIITSKVIDADNYPRFNLDLAATGVSASMGGSLVFANSAATHSFTAIDAGIFTFKTTGSGDAANGIDRLTILNNGNVGIGTTAPVAQTMVYGAGQTTTALTDAGNMGGTLLLQDSGGGVGNGGALFFGAGVDRWAAIKGYYVDGTSNGIGDLAFSTRNATGDTALTERMRIMYNGYVGIGDTTPDTLLDIVNTADAAITLEADTDNATETDNAYIRFLQDGSAIESFIGHGGDAGTGPLGAYTNSLANALLIGTIDLAADSALQFGTVSAVRMTIDTAGNVGIGTTSPGATLDVLTTRTDTAAGVGIYGIYNLMNVSAAGASDSVFQGLVSTSKITTNVNYTSQVRGGTFSGQNNAAGSTVTNLYGINTNATLSSAGAVTNAYGLQTLINLTGTASITAGYGLYAYGSDSGAGAITTAYGVYVADMAGGTTGYGLYIADQSGATDYGVYQAGATDDNYFAGKITSGGNLNLTGSTTIIEIGARGSSNTPGIDFHSGATDVDYDTRILASGGTGVAGGGTLTIYAGNVATTGNITPTGHINASNIMVSGVDVITGGRLLTNIVLTSETNTEKLCWNANYGSPGSGITAITDCTNSPGDYAEDYGTSDPTLQAGDLVAVDPTRSGYEHQDSYGFQGSKAWVVKTTEQYQTSAIGIVSTQPNDLIGQSFTPEENPRPITLSGRVPVKISAENGVINIGDPITSSSTPGVGMKATQAGRIIGMALQSSDTATDGKIIVFVNPSWYDPDVYITDSGDFNIAEVPNPGPNVNPFVLSDPSGKLVSRIGAFSEGVFANLRTGVLDAKKITTQTLAVATDSITVGGQSLRDYIASTVSQILDTQYLILNTGFTSPLASIDEIHTNIISPLGQDLQIKLGTDSGTLSKLSVTNSSGSAVATIDSAGNARFAGDIESRRASFSGRLASNSVDTNDASVSGTLRAGRIIANSIEGLEARVATLAANYISSSSTTQTTPPPTFGGDGYINMASFSAQFAMIDQGLISLGPTTLNDTSVLGTLNIGTTLSLSNNSINVLGSNLEIQPLRQGGVSFMAGLITFDTDGNMEVKGDAHFAKNVKIDSKLFAGIISPLGDELNIDLGASTSARFNIRNASGSGVFAINNKGDVSASGSGTFAKFNISFAEPALALSDTTSLATGSAGIARVKSTKTEVTIQNVLVTDKSLIYITPVGTPSAQTPFLLRQNAGTSFSVGVEGNALKDIPFNWLIIN